MGLRSLSISLMTLILVDTTSHMHTFTLWCMCDAPMIYIEETAAAQSNVDAAKKSSRTALLSNQRDLKYIYLYLLYL